MLQDDNDFTKDALGIVLNAGYSQKWIGDSWWGPGSVTMDIKADLRRAYLFPANHVLRPKRADTNIPMHPTFFADGANSLSHFSS